MGLNRRKIFYRNSDGDLDRKKTPDGRPEKRSSRSALNGVDFAQARSHRVKPNFEHAETEATAA